MSAGCFGQRARTARAVQPEEVNALPKRSAYDWQERAQAGLGARMKMVAEYLEKALNFEQMAATESSPELRARLLDQARAYRKLAASRAVKDHQPNISQTDRNGDNHC
jgi:hypothetical protein